MTDVEIDCMAIAFVMALPADENVDRLIVGEMEPGAGPGRYHLVNPAKTLQWSADVRSRRELDDAVSILRDRLSNRVVMAPELPALTRSA